MAIAGGRPVVLDISRLVSRATLTAPTGIDRVEQAYLEAFEGGDAPFFALARVPGGLRLLDRAALAAWRADAGGPDLRARLTPWRPAARRLAEARLRRHALPGGLRALPRGAVYVNVGHANLRDESFAALRTAGAETVVVMIHDTIPLDFPEHARTGTPELFRARLAAVGRAADLVIYNSEDTGRQAARHFAALGRVPPGAVIPLGLDPPAPTRAIVADPPAFVALGTIEPRKNHALLLDVWARLAADPPAGGLPPLHIIGRRGWAGPDLLARLDARPEGVEELGPLTDAEMQGRLAGARALLFPSFAEGFGFPLAEALQRGVPVIASDLPALRALGGDQVTWCDPADPAGWEAAIRVCAAPHTKRPEAVEFPTWSDHLHELTAVLRRHCDGVSDQR